MQVCLNNAIQYAKATKLSVSIQKNEDKYSVVIRNNGKPPEKVITEGEVLQICVAELKSQVV